MSDRARVAFITGVSRGIGAALAQNLLARGYVVYGCARSDDFPSGVRGFVCDIASEDQVASMFAELAEHESHIDILVQNAAVLGPRVKLADVTPRVWREVFEINVHGAFFVALGADRFLGQGACVVNVSSSVGRKGRGTWGPYACSKHALEGMTDVLADEYRDRGVRVLSMNPGGTATDMRADAFPDEDPATLPSAAAIAETIASAAVDASLAPSGAKLNCRDLL